MNAFSPNEFQKSFFKQLESQFSKRGDMVNALSDVLNVGRDAVYRRLRGDTALSADELMLLARKYSISLDGKQERAKMTGIPVGLSQINSEIEYFAGLERQILMLSEIPEVTMDYATPELPIFYELLMPTLLAFKTYVYGLTSWNFKKWKGKEFRMELIDPEVFTIAQRILAPLCNLPGRELWSVGILDVTLRQIEHAVDVGRLVDHQLTEKMFSELERVISHMEAMTEGGKRFLPGASPTDESPDFCVYHNEMTNTNSIIIIKSEEQSFVVSTFLNPDYVIVNDERVQKKMERWMENLIDNSDVLIADSSKYKERYFNQLRRSVAAARQRTSGRLIEAPGALS